MKLANGKWQEGEVAERAKARKHGFIEDTFFREEGRPRVLKTAGWPLKPCEEGVRSLWSSVGNNSPSKYEPHSDIWKIYWEST